MTITEMEELRDLLAVFALDDGTPYPLVGAARRIRSHLDWELGAAEDGSL